MSLLATLRHSLLLPLVCTLTAQAVCGEPSESLVPTDPLEPARIQISPGDLPEPYASESARNDPEVVSPPRDATLRAPEGFRVNVFAEDVTKARWLALTPDGDVLCSAGRENQITLLRDTDSNGVADQRFVFLDKQHGANLPFGMDFAKTGDTWSFVLGNTDAVLRYPYEPGQTSVQAEPEQITRLPGEGYNQHWTRNVRVAPDGEHLYVTVGSETNVDAEPSPRASVLQMRLDGSERRVFASGLRNPVGLDFHPQSGDVYVTVNERDGLGDDLVPDYFTRIQQDEFYGWPYAWLKPGNLDPRRTADGQSEQPELARQTLTPDVLFQAHSAALGLAFYRGSSFPQRYRQGAYCAFRGSWNRSEGTGYKIVFIPFDENGRPRGYYEDFLTGFLIAPEVPKTWGRPVGVIQAPDGSLLFTEESNGRIYRVQYVGG